MQGEDPEDEYCYEDTQPAHSRSVNRQSAPCRPPMSQAPAVLAREGRAIRCRTAPPTASVQNCRTGDGGLFVAKERL